MSSTHRPSRDSPCLIIGAGVIGASCAFFLAQKGFKPTVLEAASCTAAASSGKAGGFLARDWCDGGAMQQLARVSFDMHVQNMAGNLCGGDVSTLGYRRCNALALHLGKGKGNYQHDPPSWVDSREVASVSPAATADAAMQVHPCLLTRHLLAQAEAAGARVICNAALADVHVTEDGRICGVDVIDPRQPLAVSRRFDADICIFCMGPWTCHLPHILLKRCSAAAAAVRACLPPRLQRVHSIVVEDRERQCGPTALFCSGIPIDDPEIYPRPDATVYMCGGSSFDALPPCADDVLADTSVVQQLQLALVATVPCLQGQPLLQRQACYLPSSADGMPVIGPTPHLAGAFIATGHTCWGILTSLATGYAIAGMVTGDIAAAAVAQPFLPARFEPAES